MLDVRDLLTSATLEPGELPEIDFDALARRGARRRVGKRIGATALVLVVLGGSLVLVDEAFGGPDLHIADQPGPLPPIVDQPDQRVDQPDEHPTDPPDAGDWEWLPLAPLDARQDPFVAALEDGRIVVAGGSVPGSSRSRTDVAVLSADRTSWTRLPDAPFFGRLVQFTVRGSTLWARKAPQSGDPAFAEYARLARLDLDQPNRLWEELPAPPVDGVVEPIVMIFDDTAVVFGATIETATGHREDVSVASGAVWRDGTWTPFGPPPRPVTAAFIGVDADHIAVVGGQTDGEVIADTSILDLDTATWRTAYPMPAGPRIHTDPAASAIVVDGRMFVVGGYADPIVPTPPDDDWPLEASPVPCPPFAEANPESPPSGGPPQEMDCHVLVDPWRGESDETASSDLSSSSGSSTGGWPDVPATGAAWLDLATGTWEVVQPPVDQTVPHAVRPDDLTAPTTLKLTGPRASGDLSSHWRLDTAGRLTHVRLPPLPFSATHIELDGDGEPALALATRDDWLQGPNQAVAIPDDRGRFIEATVPEPLNGVTYILIDGQLHAFGGVPYGTGRDDDGGPDPSARARLLARVLRR